MVESSKILTVSYGTFSCTLEGFDDSFGTMKAIAEYFRDLAQGDRYFGAEPPAPDAEMLTRIAEKEIARRVEARADESGIVLRAVDAPKAPAAPVMPPVVSAPTKEAVAEVETATAERADAPTQVEAAQTQDISESTHAATADMDGDVAGPEVGDDESPTLVASSPATPAATDLSMDDEMDMSAPAATFEDMAPAALPTVPAHPDADSVAAKLQRIRAVVGGGAMAQTDPVKTAVSTDVADDETDADAHAMAADAVDVQAEAETETEADFEDTFDAMAAAFADDDETDETDETAEDDSDVIASDEEEVADEDMASELDHVALADSAEDAEEDDVAEDVSEASPAAVSDESDETEVAQTAAPAEKLQQNFRARILRVSKRVAPLAAAAEVSADKTATIADQIRATVAAQTGEDSLVDTQDPADSLFEDIGADEIAELAPSSDDAIATLSDEDEAELLADLAEVEAEMALDDAEDEVAQDAPAAPAMDAAPAGRHILPETNDAAMSRIMEEADEQLSEPEGSRRRSAIAQLKAAVAATEAARQLGDKANDAAAKESAFREDLHDAVRPGTHQPLPRTQVRAERPRPAPLKLVASQRVDESTPAAPVMPRRVKSEAVADAGSFADFAAEMGATELPDLLEAAAAYTAYVEGIEDFSRPQIMKKVQSFATQEFSREDGLRSFGTLLRQGRISKVRNGRFQVSDQTRFKPEQKAG